MLVDHLRQMLVEPLLEHRPEHPANDLLKRINSRRRWNRRSNRLELLERLSALAGRLLVNQRGPRSMGGASGWSSSRTSSSAPPISSGSGSSSSESTDWAEPRNSFSSAITFLIEARMSSIEGSRPGDCMRADIAYWGGGVTPGTTGGDGSIRAESICGVTTGVAGISSGATVRVAMVG